MDRDFLQRLLSRDTLLAIGVTLFVLGLILRGLAREHQRTLAQRKLHELDTRKKGALRPKSSHFEKHLMNYASAVAVVGAVVAVMGFLR
jgi:hypothetical protein